MKTAILSLVLAVAIQAQATMFCTGDSNAHAIDVIFSENSIDSSYGTYELLMLPWSGTLSESIEASFSSVHLKKGQAFETSSLKDRLALLRFEKTSENKLTMSYKMGANTAVQKAVLDCWTQ